MWNPFKQKKQYYTDEEMSVEDGKKIFEVRYKDGILNDDTGVETDHRSFMDTECQEELMRKFEAESQYVERTQAKEGKRQFLICAKKFSKKHRIDMDIFQRRGYIQADLYIPCGSFGNDFIGSFAILLLASSTIRLSQPPERLGYTTISLTYRTHDHYIGGRKMTR